MEGRLLLSVEVLEETFKTQDWIATGTFAGQFDTEHTNEETGELEPCRVSYSGDVEVYGTAVFDSPTHGTDTGTGGGTITVAECPHSPEMTFDFSGHGAGTDENGFLTGWVAIDLPVEFGPFEGSATLSSATFDANVVWSFPEPGGSWSGSVVPVSSEPYDMSLTAEAWSEREIDFTFHTVGPVQPTLSRSTPITDVRLFWADGNEELKSEALATSSVYWNQESGSYHVTLSGVPSGARHLLLVADPDLQVTESDETNNALLVRVAMDDSYWVPSLGRDVLANEGVLVNDREYSGEALTATLVSGPSHAGEFEFHADGSFYYKPADGFHGTDSFTYRTSDGSRDTNVATVEINVADVPTYYNVTFDDFYQKLWVIPLTTPLITRIQGTQPNLNVLPLTTFMVRPVLSPLFAYQQSAAIAAEDGSLQLKLFDQDLHLLATSTLIDGEQRIDWLTDPNEDYFLSVEGPAIDIELCIASLVQPSADGTEITVHGTKQDDEFSVDIGSQEVTIDGIRYDFSTYPSLRSISFIGDDGSDTAVVQGSAQGENARIWPGKARFMASGLDMWIFDTETITTHGGGGDDTARLFDSVGTDVFTSDPQSASMVGDGFSNTVQGFRYVYGVAGSGGEDTAYLYDSDESDVLRADPINVVLSSNSFFERASQFRYVYAYGNHEDTDSAILTGSGGDDQLDAGVEEARLFDLAGTYDITAEGFETVTAYGGDGSDVANLYDSPGDDTLAASPSRAVFTGPGLNNSAVGFETVIANSTGGVDTSTFTDSAGNDRFIVTSTSATMSGAGYSLTANQFRRMHGLALSGGSDSAYLYDSLRNDTYRADGAQGRMFYGNGVFGRARYFDSYFTYSTAGGHDKAIVNGTEGRDIYYGTPTVSRLYGSSYYHRVVQYDEVEAYGKGGVDAANLTDSTSDDYLEAAGTWAKLSCTQIRYSILVDGFRPVTAKSSNVGDKKHADVDFLIATGYWEDV